MEVNAVPLRSASPAPTSPPSETAQDVVGKDAFLQLLVAQLEHQDPLSPMDNTEFTAQLAQFSALEQMTAINTGVQSLLTSQGTASKLQATGFIGKEIQADGGSTQVRQGGASPLTYTLAEASANTVITITNDAGQTLRTITAVNQPAGTHELPWQGQDDLGNPLPAGTYQFTVTATAQTGDPVEANTFLRGVVEGVEFDGNTALLMVGGRPVDLASVLSVQELQSEED
jgi:flagellar basal-body rod modification protein FlgD